MGTKKGKTVPNGKLKSHTGNKNSPKRPQRETGRAKKKHDRLTCQRTMNKLATTLSIITLVILLFKLVESIYDGDGTWSIVLNAILVILCICEVYALSSDRQKEKKDN